MRQLAILCLHQEAESDGMMVLSWLSPVYPVRTESNPVSEQKRTKQKTEIKKEFKNITVRAYLSIKILALCAYGLDPPNQNSKVKYSLHDPRDNPSGRE